jgi:hypothetical protein
MLRIVGGFCLAPIVAATLTTAFSSLGPAIPGACELVRASDLPPSSPGTVFVWALMFASAATLVGAVPVFRVLQRRGALSLRAHLVAGATLGIAPFLVLGVLGIVRAAVDHDAAFVHESVPRLAADAMVAVGAGTIAAVSFYLVAGWRPTANLHTA